MPRLATPPPCVAGTNNTYACVRRVDPSASLDDILCSFTCYDAGRVEVPCPQDQPEGYGEYVSPALVRHARRPLRRQALVATSPYVCVWCTIA
jgi:hypothetical protein